MLSLDYKIRLYQRRDNPGLQQCVKAFYGGGYPYPEFLDAEELDRRIAAGDLILTVAVTPEDKVVGTVAAERQHGAFENTVVLKLRNVLPECRGSGIASAQLKDLLERIAKQFPDALSIYADVMTHDAVSQSSLIHKGYALCGLRLMVYTSRVMVPFLGFPAHTKMTQAIYCRRLREHSVSVFAPAEHRGKLAELYTALGAPCTFLEGGGMTAGKSDLQITVTPRFSKAEIILRQAGDDLDGRLKEFLEGKSAWEDFTCVAYLNMKDPGCPAAYEIFRNNGFYFSGILPLTEAGEYLLLSKTDRCLENFELIALGDGGEDFISYIRSKR